jgi:ribosome-binding factor A
MARCEKVASAIQKEVSSIIHDELKDPRLGFVTITRVELTSDLRFAKIFFSVLGGDQERAKTQEALNSAMGFIRRLLAERVQLRFAPEIIFKMDKSSEYSIRIQQIIDEVNKNNEPKKSSKPPKRKK